MRSILREVLRIPIPSDQALRRAEQAPTEVTPPEPPIAKPAEEPPLNHSE